MTSGENFEVRLNERSTLQTENLPVTYNTEVSIEDPSPNGVAINHISDEISFCTLKSGEHQHTKARKDNEGAMKKLLIATGLCFLFICGELTGGAIAHSLAVMTDAAHLVTDLIAFVISLLAILLGRKGPNRRLTFGWYRAEMLGAMFSIQLIWVVTGVLVYLAIERVRTMDFRIEALPMVITASCGVVMNIIMATVLHQKVPVVGHGHSHTFGHSHTNDSNINVRAAFIHCIGDLIQSLGVLVAAIIIYFKPEYKIVDPICTFISSVLVMGSTIFIFRDLVMVLMEGAPRAVSSTDLNERLTGIPGVTDVHNIRLWSLSSDKIACNIHIAIDPTETSANAVLQRCHEILNEIRYFHDSTIQVEEMPVNQPEPQYLTN